MSGCFAKRSGGWRSRSRLAAVCAALSVLAYGSAVASPVARTLMLRGRPQQLWCYGQPSNRVAIVSSGDGGWMHLAPDVAEWLSTHGWYVVGFDSKKYLSSFTDHEHALTPDVVPRDYETLVRSVGAAKPVLIGVSEGGGLSVLAAADASVRPRIAGVITIGVGDPNEIAWRWSDSVIYVTKGVPKEPLFHAGDYISRIAPVPVALLRSSHDEYVPRGQSDRLAALAREPKRVWTIAASDHRFSDNVSELHQRLSEALGWIAGLQHDE